jgi:hypothetical protein
LGGFISLYSNQKPDIFWSGKSENISLKNEKPLKLGKEVISILEDSEKGKGKKEEHT